MHAWKRSAALFAATLSISVLGPAASAGHTSFAAGDIFASVGGSSVQWRHADGTANRTLTSPVSMPQTTGMAFDPGGALYVTGYTSNVITRFDTSGSSIGAFGSSYSAHPKSIRFDAAGNAYVGLGSGSKDVLKMDGAGNVLASYDVATSKKGGADWIDLAADQCTFYYTNLGSEVKRFDACANAQLPDLASGLPGTAHEVRVLLDGGAVVALGDTIVRLGPTGSIAQVYDVAGVKNCWQSVALGTTSATFLAADSCSSTIHTFDMATGASSLLASTGVKKGSLQGLAVFGGITAATAGADLAVVKSDSVDPVSQGGQVVYTVGVTNNGSGPVSDIRVEDALSGGSTIVSISGTGWTCAATPTAATCDLAGSLAGGASAEPLRIRVLAPTTGSSIANTASVTSLETGFVDSVPGNDTAIEMTALIDPALDPDSAATDCAPGEVCTLETSSNFSGDNNTSNQIEIPAGEGGAATLNETPLTGIASCVGGSGGVSEGQLTTFVPPPGVADTANPIRVVTRYASALIGPGESVIPICMRSEIDGMTVEFEVPPCLNPGHANPPTPEIPNGACIEEVHQVGTVEGSAAGAGATSDVGVTPTLVAGNPTCASINPGWDELRVNGSTSGTYTDGTLTVDATFSSTPADGSLAWSSDLGVDAVLVKGGADASLYASHSEATSDSGLTAPLNPVNGKYFGISHVSYCYGDVDWQVRMNMLSVDPQWRR